MHELSISSAVVDTVVKHAAGRSVSGVHLRLGTLRQVVPESLEFFFGLVARDTVCEGATLTWDVITARLRCAACGHDWEIDVPAFRCPRCDGTDVEVLAGRELEVETIEVEEATCTA